MYNRKRVRMNMKHKRAVIVFTRVPVPGKTKTRLMPYFTPKQCEQIHICLLRDMKRECEQAAADIFVCYTPEDKEKKIRKIFGKEAKYFPQRGEDLGVRMYVAIEDVLKMGYDSCILFGTDIPELHSTDMENAFRVLETKDIVFGPTEDGGYYLVGMNAPHKEVFEKQSYGHASVMENTLAGLKEAGLQVGFIRELSDIDRKEDVIAFRQKMRENSKLQKTQTGKYLMRTTKISIIIPIYNEETTILAMKRQMEGLKDKCEVIFVDGGSTDRTLELLGDTFPVYHSDKGKAAQMNVGAKNSHGDILCFLHCDSEIPVTLVPEIRYVMKDHQAGCFGIAFHSKNFFMWTCRVISNHRIKDRKVMFGDQGIFVTRELFFEAGMFAELPILEDYQFSLTLKEKDIRLGMARHRIYTSDRRFPDGTIPKLKLMWLMNRLRKMYRDGVPIEKIASLYKDVR